MTRLLAIALLAAGSILAVPAAYTVGDDSPAPPGAAADPVAEAGKAAIRG
jgi:hypothetical protein